MSQPLFSILLSLLLISPSLASLCLTGSAPFQLSTSCAPGYYCPLYNASDPSTYPVQCAATNDCLLDRLATKFCDAQGTYEPTLCPKGFYCPTATEKLPCPEGYVCPLGTQTPFKCGVMTTCAEGSDKKTSWASVIALLVSDVGMISLFFLAKRLRRQWIDYRDRHYKQASVTSVVSSLQDKGDVYHQMPSHMKFLCHGFYRARAHLPPMRIEFADLSLTIPAKDKKPAKTLLKGVTGSIEAGKVTAIMGPSGAGKTTFLNCLLEKNDPTWIRGGSLQVNGVSENLARFRNIIGYVPQDDIMHHDLSVYDNISYAAHVRLPRDWTAEQREDHINAVISAMQLSHVQDVRIGDAAKRGVSGGQRKRCNIGMEVAAAPSLLLLDEPTSGLDSTSAMEICQVIKELSIVSSLTVAMVIHQPRIEIWNQLDELLLLAPGGLTVYQGPQRLAVDYFKQRLDVTLAAGDNPADALMDRIAESADEFVQAWKEGGPAFVDALKSRNHIGSSAPVLNVNDLPADPNRRLENPAYPPILSATAPDTVIPIKTAFEIDSPTPAQTKGQQTQESKPSGYYPFPQGRLREAAPFFHQMLLACRRSLWKQAGNLPSLGLETGLGTFAGLLMGALVTLKYQGILSPPYTLLSPTPMIGLIPQVFSSIGLAMSLAAASAGVSVFGEEMVIYRREIANGHSHPAYYIGVTIAQLPRLYCDAIHFAFVFHVFNQPYSGFEVWLPITFFLYLAIYGLAAFVTMLVSRKNAPLLGVVLCLFFSNMTRKGGIPEFIQIQSAARWGAEAVFGVETEPYRHFMTVDRDAEQSGYGLDRFWFDMLLMCWAGVFYRIVAYAAMVWGDRELLFGHAKFCGCFSRKKNV